MGASARDGHGRRLSVLDSSFLRLERPDAHMHFGWSATFSVPAGAERPTLEVLRARVAGRLHRVPRSRQRLCGAPLGVGEPRWVDDPDFDVAAHVTAPTRPTEALTLASFGALRDGLLARPLDRARPLWHVALVPCLADGRLGIVGRVHHAMADGVSATQIAMLLLDSGDGEPELPIAWTARDAPGPARWMLDPLADGARLAAGSLQAVTHAALRPRSSAREALKGAGRIALALRHDTLPRAPRSPLNTPNGPRRTLVGCRASFGELPGDGTLNEIGLAVVAGVLRRLALERCEPAGPLKAMVPVSVRRPPEHADLGNRISSAAVWLPLDLGSPGARLASVRDQTRRFKRTRRPQGAQTLVSGLSLLQGPLRDAALRAAAAARSYNLIVSNVAGPPTAVTMLGARLEEISPVVPIGHGHALAIGMLSYNRSLHFGLHADPDALPEVSALPGLIAEEVAALRDAGRSGVGSVASISARRALAEPFAPDAIRIGYPTRRQR